MGATRPPPYGASPSISVAMKWGRFPDALRVHTWGGMTRALLLSLLSRQCLLLKPAAFRERYPHGWLVWESGVWNVPEIGEELGTTRVPAREIADCLPES